MKNYKLTIITIVAFACFASAQEVRLGVKAGLNLANLSTETEQIGDYNTRTGLLFGIMAEMPISKKFAFQPELLFSAQGAKNEINIEEYKYKGTQKLNYLNIPLLFKYFISEGFTIQAGPQVGFLMLAKNDYEDNYLGVGYAQQEENISDYMNIVDFGLNFGLGYQLQNGLYIDARYNLGLTNLRNNNDGLDTKQYNRVIQFSIGYFLN